MVYTGTVPYTAQDFTAGQKALAQDATNMSYAIARVDKAVSVPLGATLTIGSDTPSGENVIFPGNGASAVDSKTTVGEGSIFYISGWDYSSRGQENGMVAFSSGKTDRVTIPPGGAGFYSMQFTATINSEAHQGTPYYQFVGPGAVTFLVYVYASGSSTHYDEGGISLSPGRSSLSQGAGLTMRGAAGFSRPLADGDFVKAYISNNFNGGAGPINNGTAASGGTTGTSSGQYISLGRIRLTVTRQLF